MDFILEERDENSHSLVGGVAGQLKIGMAGRELVHGDFIHRRLVVNRPDRVEDSAAGVDTQQQSQAQQELGGMNGDSESAKDVRERQYLPPIDAPEHLPIVRHGRRSFRRRSNDTATPWAPTNRHYSDGGRGAKGLIYLLQGGCAL